MLPWMKAGVDSRTIWMSSDNWSAVIVVSDKVSLSYSQRFVITVERCSICNLFDLLNV